jgi:hypothetical protein
MKITYTFEKVPTKTAWDAAANLLRKLVEANPSFTMKGSYRLHSLFQRSDSGSMRFRSFKPHSIKVGRSKHNGTGEDVFALCWGNSVEATANVADTFELVRCDRSMTVKIEEWDFSAVILGWLVLLSNHPALPLNVSIGSIPEAVKSQAKRLSNIDGLCVLPDWLTGRVSMPGIVRPDSLDFRA